MHGYFIPADAPVEDENVSVREVMRQILRHRLVIGICTALFAIGALIWALNASPVYRASALVKVVEEPGNIGGLAGPGQFSGLAALAGLRLPAGNARAEAVAVLQSNSLAEQFIRDHELMPLLFADRWNAAIRQWRGGGLQGEPSMAEAVKRFVERVRLVQEDKLTGLVKVSVRWREPKVAAIWANDLISLANERMRARAVNEANGSLRFLEKEIDKTNNIELQQVILRLMQEQLNAVTLASVRAEYALQTIDPARAPDADDYVWPRPAVLLALGLVVGTLVGALLALLLEWRRRQT